MVGHIGINVFGIVRLEVEFSSYPISDAVMKIGRGVKNIFKKKKKVEEVIEEPEYVKDERETHSAPMTAPIMNEPAFPGLYDIAPPDFNIEDTFGGVEIITNDDEKRLEEVLNHGK